MRVQVDIVVEPDGDGFHTYVPALPGLHSCGQTEDEAVQNATEAVVAYLESMLKHGDPLPIGCVAAEGQAPRGWRPGLQPHQHVQSVVLPLP